MMQMLGQGFLVSLQLFVLTLLGSIPLGIPVAFMRMSKIAPLRWIARIYISVMRGTPLMLQMFAIYFAPYYVFGISLTPDSKWTACVVAFIINYAGYFGVCHRRGRDVLDGQGAGRLAGEHGAVCDCGAHLLGL